MKKYPSISLIVVGLLLLTLVCPSALSTKKVFAQKECDESKRKNSVNRPLVESNIFSLLFLFVTLGAFLSHIAYDVIVYDNATFPLLAPFSYSQFVIPRIYGLPLEMAGFIFLFLIYHVFIFYGNDKRFSYQKNQYVD
jgi:hypothetical protein